MGRYLGQNFCELSLSCTSDKLLMEKYNGGGVCLNKLLPIIHELTFPLPAFNVPLSKINHISTPSSAQRLIMDFE